MAFIDIQDPVKREETVKEYMKNIKEIRERRENEKLRGISQRQNIEKVFQPVVQATEKSASQITSEIKNLKEPKESRPKSQALDYYLNLFNKSKLDQYYGIFERDGTYWMGDKEIKVDEFNNILLDDVAIKGTKGLWRLIMMKTPEFYEAEDLDNYRELHDRTNACETPYVTSSSDRPKSTSKWNFLREIIC